VRVTGRKVICSSADVRRFNAAWPCSELRATRSYWFEFDSQFDLVDTDCPESDDGTAAAAMADDCRAYLESDELPGWAELEAQESAPEPQAEHKPLVQLIAAHLDAMARCAAGWRDYHESAIEWLCREHLPSGSGFDSGSTLAFADSRPDRLCFETSFHHMNDSGHYDGWTQHRVIASPSFVLGFELKVTGRDRRQIKDYIAETFSQALSTAVADYRLPD
jgi:hypothetical protein